MAQRIVQINVNHCRSAQDLAVQRMFEVSAGVLCISEPYLVPPRENWVSDLLGSAAIYGDLQKCVNFKAIARGNGFVAAMVSTTILYSCYISPNVSLEDFEIFLRDVGDSIAQLRGKSIIITGDFNSKHRAWGSKISNSRGNVLMEWIALHRLIIVNTGNTPTCSRATGESIVDLTLCTEDMSARVREWKVQDGMESLSDHRYIQFVLDGNGRARSETTQGRSRYPKWDHKKMNDDLFKAALITGNWTENVENRTPEEATHRLMKTLIEAANISMPKIKQECQLRRKAYWWNLETAEARKRCNSARRRLKRTKRTGNMEIIATAVTNLRNARIELNNSIRAAKRNSWMDLVRSVEDDPWGKPYKIIMKKCGSSSTPVTEALDKEFLASVLEYLFPERNNGYPMITFQSGDICEVSDGELIGIIQRMKVGVAPGPDGITAEIIRRAHCIIHNMLKNTYSECLKKGSFPAAWKEGRLVLLRKPAKPEERPSSYRPICVLSEVGKTFERITSQRIEAHLSSGPNISCDQYGFRKNKSTIDAILEFKSRIKKILEWGGYAVAVSLDISNAFNTLPWNFINEEMERKNFPDYIRAIVHNYLQNRTISYINSESRMVRKRISCGVPQGSVLGPTLWNIAYDKVLSRSTCHGCSTLCYADDTLLISRGRRLEEAIGRAELGTNILITRIEEMGLKVAIDKMEIVIFSPVLLRTEEKFIIGGRMIKSKPCMKYLGVMVDKNWDMREHFSYTANKGLGIINKLARIMPNVGGPSEGKRRLYCTVAHSVLMYAAPVWAEELVKRKARRELRKLQAAQKVICARVISSYRTAAYLAVLILSRVLPVEIQAGILKKVYDRKRSLMDGEFVDKNVIKKFQKIMTEDAIIKWKIRLNKVSLPGERVRAAIVPHFSRWFNGLLLGELTYRMTQIITGHGCFAAFLYCIGKAESPACGYCGNVRDDAQHTLQHCPRWDNERNRLMSLIGNDLSLVTVVSRILEDKDNWKAFRKFAEAVMVQKEKKEREDEEELRLRTQNNRR